jgi:hypothetical protein
LVIEALPVFTHFALSRVRQNAMAKTVSYQALEARPRGLAPKFSDRRIAFYRAKADECQIMAMLAADDETRDQWLLLANQWTYLSLHSHLSPFNGADLN